MPARTHTISSVALLFLLAGQVAAGGGSETLLVVVNADSPLSWFVARDYCARRGVPEEHVLALRDVPGVDVISVAEFREGIWKPIREYMEQHGLEDEIDCIAYSADFPYAVDFTADLGGADPGQQIGRLASLTGLTYLARRVENADTSYLDLQVNGYYRGKRARQPTEQERNAYRTAVLALQNGNHQVAADAFRELLATYEGDASSWYNYACCLSLLGRANDALDALEKAVDHGWRDAAHTRQDTDLTSLRGKTEFEDLLGRMAAPAPLELLPTMAFDASATWGEDAIDRYYLCTMLAYTGQRGNSLGEVRGYLAAAAGSDFTRPGGTVYFCKNGDVRSRTREHMFLPVGARLAELGRRATILEAGQGRQDGKIPQGMSDVAGAVIGIAGFDWGKSGSEILPGAICEHLTSFGAAFRAAGQTKLTEFLRYGAAGASGTVTEPLALFAKFPSPAIHLHYAEGASLAEAFYESVSGPYQLLIVGDPLARPHAHRAKVTWREPAGNADWQGVLRIEADIESAPERPVGTIELWVDGQRLQTAAPEAGFTLDTTTLDDGVHEALLVAIEADPLGTRSAVSARCRVRNHERPHSTSASADVTLGEPVRIEGTIAGAKEVEILRGLQVLAAAKPDGSGAWSAEVPSAALGLGVCQLFARAQYPDGTADRGEPIPVRVREPASLAAIADEGSPWLPGATLLARDAGGATIPLPVTDLDVSRARPLTLPQGFTAATISVSGDLQVTTGGFQQLLVDTQGALEVLVDGRSVHESDTGGVVRLPLFLEPGWHAVDLQLTPRGKPHLRLELVGGEVAARLGEAPQMRTRLQGLAPAEPGPRVLAGKDDALEMLCDGERGGTTAPFPEEGLILAWKKRCKGMRAVVLHLAADGQGATPIQWQVEVPRGKGGKPVSGLTVTYGPARSAGKDQPVAPPWVKLEFAPVAVKALRLRATRDGKPATGVLLTEVEAYVTGGE